MEKDLEIPCNQLLEQYKLYTQMVDNVSARRVKVNLFYVVILSSLLVIPSFNTNSNNLGAYIGNTDLLTFSSSLFGIIACIVWWLNIKSYRQLNTAKFKVLHEMESNLGFAPYTREWEYLNQGNSFKKYLKLTVVESFIPFILITPYLILMIHSLLKLNLLK